MRGEGGGQSRGEAIAGHQVTLDRAERDALHGDLINHLSGIGDVFLLIERRDWENAKRLRRAFELDLRLLDDIGWEPDPAGVRFALTLAPAELAETLARLHSDATAAIGIYAERDPSDDEMAARDALACATYGTPARGACRPRRGARRGNLMRDFRLLIRGY